MADKPLADAGAQRGLVVDRNQLAYLFDDCDVSLITKLARDGHLVKASFGKYDFAESNRGYIRHLRLVAASHISQSGKIDAVEEAALLRRAQREAMEMKRDEIAGKLIDIPALEEVWGEIIREFRNIVMSIPSTVMFDLPHIDKADIEAIKRICRDILRVGSLRGINKKIGPIPKAKVDEKDLQV